MKKEASNHINIFNILFCGTVARESKANYQQKKLSFLLPVTMEKNNSFSFRIYFFY